MISRDSDYHASIGKKQSFERGWSKNGARRLISREANGEWDRQNSQEEPPEHRELQQDRGATVFRIDLLYIPLFHRTSRVPVKIHKILFFRTQQLSQTRASSDDPKTKE
ncbi:hypothetical protein HYQ46_001671 [Verticillium longisporum]|nr:hypothetical protein HYQ46_001671 [Verticillium longisporum]